MNFRLIHTVIGLLAGVFACTVSAQNFPVRPLTLICPWPPGGSTDLHLRKFAEIAAKYVGQSIIIENRPGAGGTVGPSQMAANAKPDGYTLAQYPISLLRVPHMQKSSWDPLKDFTFIIGLTGYTFGIVVRSDSPIKTLQELIDYARANPNKVTYGSTGNGTTPHLNMEQLASKANVQMLHVPFKGNADSTQALMGGHIMVQSDSTGWGRHVDAGSFRLLVTFGENRTKRWNTVATAKELGLGIVSNSPYGIVAPRGMDAQIVKFLHDAFKKALDDPEHLKILEQLDQEYWYKSSEDFAKWAVEEFQIARQLIERVGLLTK
ncbi:MAG: tripartite tricarboxylate transporter substrate binding protein [Betaproteobacteria bacterium]|nr:tripartite tricarboxylate transporter substrate binding protein [Betaproteobacteria bacterium]